MLDKIKTIWNKIKALFTIKWKTFFMFFAKIIGGLAIFVYLCTTILLVQSESYSVGNEQIQKQYNNVFHPDIFKEKIGVDVKPISEYKYFEKEEVDNFDYDYDKTAINGIKTYINKYAGEPVDMIFYRENEKICDGHITCKSPYEDEFNYTSYLFKGNKLLLIKKTYFFYGYPTSINDSFITISHYYTDKGDFLFATILNRDNHDWNTYIFDKNKNIEYRCPNSSVHAVSCIHKKYFNNFLYKYLYHQIDILGWTALVTGFLSYAFIMPVVVLYLICRFLIWVWKRIQQQNKAP